MKRTGESAGIMDKEIEELLGGQNYPRLRMGIGMISKKGRQLNFV